MPWRRWTNLWIEPLFTFAEGATGEITEGSFSAGKLVIAVTPENADPAQTWLVQVREQGRTEQDALAVVQGAYVSLNVPQDDEVHTAQLEVSGGLADVVPVYSSADASVASVDQNGLVTAAGLGSTVVTVEKPATTVGDVAYQRAVAHIAVDVQRRARTASFSKEKVIKSLGASPFTVAATLAPAVGSAVYSIDDTSIATINAETGEITLADPATVGETIVRAVVAETAVYRGAVDSYTLQVVVNQAPEEPTIKTGNYPVPSGGPGPISGFPKANDPDEQDELTYEIIGGANAALFEFVDGELQFKEAPTFVQDGDNDYEVTVRATDNRGDDSASVEYTVIITVTKPEISEYQGMIDPRHISVSETSGIYYVYDEHREAILKADTTGEAPVMTEIASAETGQQADPAPNFTYIEAMVYNPDDGLLWAADWNRTDESEEAGSYRIYTIDPKTGDQTLLIKDESSNGFKFSALDSLNDDPDSTGVMATDYNKLFLIASDGTVTVITDSVNEQNYLGFAEDVVKVGTNYCLVSATHNAVLRVAGADNADSGESLGDISIFSRAIFNNDGELISASEGDGPGIYSPSAVTADANGNLFVYNAHSNDARKGILKVTPNEAGTEGDRAWFSRTDVGSGLSIIGLVGSTPMVSDGDQLAVLDSTVDAIALVDSAGDRVRKGCVPVGTGEPFESPHPIVVGAAQG